MFEISIDLLSPSSWSVIYLSFLLGLSVSLIYYVMVDHTFIHSLSQDSNHSLNYLESGCKTHRIYTLLGWIAKIIRRKESPSEDIEDHYFFLVI